ncbi:MAG: hypothetical protein OQK98_09730 [Gammaproteobacteria bacterium]|nr:hypothetical protein [Gammaproteobacteria bacterium]
MNSLISPDYNFEVFCYQVIGKDPGRIIEEASAEITRAKRLHKMNTRDSSFRKGSKGKSYCEKLQHLVYTMMNGSIPTNTPPEFKSEIRPLVKRVLEQWDVGQLRAEFENNDD